MESEQHEKAQRLEQAEKKIRDGEFIEAQDFEALCEKYGVQLPIKLLGWLREWCTVVNFTQYGIKRDRYNKSNAACHRRTGNKKELTAKAKEIMSNEEDQLAKIRRIYARNN